MLKFLFAFFVSCGLAKGAVSLSPGVGLSDLSPGSSGSGATMLRTLVPPDYNGSNIFLSVTHPDILYVKGGWNGYAYWMVYTPYPDSIRENPCVAVSRDGVNWSDFGNNPIAPNSEATSAGAPGPYAYQADGDIVLQSNGVMAVYYMNYTVGATPKTALCRKTSTDGRTWSSRTSLITATGANSSDYSILSPAIVVETNGTLSMFYCRQTAASMDPQARLAWRQSTDNGATWGGETVITFSTNRFGGPEPWHIDVCKVDDFYYMLVKHSSTQTDPDLYFGWSTNLSNWEFMLSSLSYQSGITNFDAGGVYRSTMVPRASNPLTLDFWISGIPAKALPGSLPGAVNSDQPWRVGLLTGIQPLPMLRGNLDGYHIVPPASLIQYASTAWPGASNVILNRFSIREPQRIRYINYAVGTQSGSNELGIVQFKDPSSLTGRTIYTSGVQQVPGAGNRRVDIGREVVLPPGDYAVYMWCDVTTAFFYQGFGNTTTAARIALHMTGAFAAGTGGTMLAVPKTVTWLEQGYSISGLTLSRY